MTELHFALAFRAVCVCVLPLGVQRVPGSHDGLDQGVRPDQLLRRGLGAGVRLSALLIPHGFDVAAAPHPTARNLIILPAAGVAPPLVLGNLCVEQERKWTYTFPLEI